ncbi:MAG: hypothetical protein GY909_06465 [Oligoflexia bacterium]|nr:hypothetical protein [Oligoflexia bacterium]
MLKLLTFILLTASLSSCLVKKPKEELPDASENKLSIVAKGFFTVKETLYYSNGKDTYCMLKDWDQANFFKTKVENPEILIQLDDFPDSQKLIPVCNMDILLDN